MIDEVVPKEKKRYKKNYINNIDFTKALVDWKRAREFDQTARMPEYIGQCFVKLTENIGRLNKFRNYSYLQDMQSEALLTCVSYATNFNPTISENPFAYFSQYIHNSFIGILNKEKRISDTKFSYIKNKFDVCEGYDYRNFMPDGEEE